MICLSCRERVHENCRGLTWCDCQHRVPEMEAPPLPPEILDVIDRLATDPSYGVRRERPVRKEENDAGSSL